MKKIVSKNMNRNTNIQTSKLCAFGSLDYIILASTLAVALGEELSSNDINILATFVAVLADELALIAAVEVCPSNNEGEQNRANRSENCHKGLYYNRMQIRNGSYNKTTGKVTFEWRLTMNDFAVSWEGGGSAKVCIAKVGSTSCYSSSLGTYNFNSSSWLGKGKSTSWKEVTVDVSNYPNGNYKVISSGDGSFAFSKLDYTNRTFFTVS
jgi:hypothetical protein